MDWGVSHIAIAVPSIARAAAALRRTYGMEASAPCENTAQGVRMAYVDLAGGGRLELMEPLTADSGVGRFLARNPAGGVHHISFSTPDIETSLQQLALRDVHVLGDGHSRNVHGDRIAFIHPRDFLGVLVELEQAPGHGSDH
ncbi:MAG: VOC family protein [Pseudomonadota bacterium]